MNELGLSFLKWLQAHRTPAMEEFFFAVTRSGEGFWLLAVVGLLFWVFGARIAYRMGFALATGDLLTGALKSTFLHSAAVAARSGHPCRCRMRSGGLLAIHSRAGTRPTRRCCGAGRRPRSGVGGCGCRRWCGSGWSGCSRMVLGVHTPLDVGTSLVLAIPVVWAMGWVYDWTERNPSRAWLVLAGAVLVALAAWAFVHYKPMPEDSDPGFSKDAFRAVWGMLGFFGAWFVERKYIRFDPARLGGYRVLAVAIGVLVLSLMLAHLSRLLAPFLGAEIAAYAAAAANPIWIFVVWPFLLKGLEKPPRASAFRYS